MPYMGQDYSIIIMYKFIYIVWNLNLSFFPK